MIVVKVSTVNIQYSVLINRLLSSSKRIIHLYNDQPADSLESEEFQRPIHACRCNECSITAKSYAGRLGCVIIQYSQLLPLLTQIHSATR